MADATLPQATALDAAALDQLFRTARTYNAFSGEVDDATLHRLYELVKFAPTAANSSPARFVFVRSEQAKARLAPLMDEGNRAKTASAPVSVIVGFDQDFHEKLPYLFPHTDAKSWFDGPREGRHVPAFRNGSLQGAYLIRAARAGAGCRPDVRLRCRRRGCGVLRRYPGQVQLHRQPGSWRPGIHLPALAATSLRRGMPHPLSARPHSPDPRTPS